MISQRKRDTAGVFDVELEDAIAHYTPNNDVCVYQERSTLDDLVPHHEAAGQHALPSYAELKHKQRTETQVSEAVRPVRVIRISDQGDPMVSVRSFVGGLSHCYNNLLMGIWGHASLIGMIFDKSDPFQSWLEELEDLIQDGSNLIHLLFGFIAERRYAAKMLRFRQLSQELTAYRRTCGDDNRFSAIEACIRDFHQATGKVQIAASITSVVDQMQGLILERRDRIDEQRLAVSKKAMIHLNKIDEIISRGNQLIRNLQFYGRTIIPVRKPVRLKKLIQRQAVEFAHQCPSLQLSLSVSAPVPQVEADLGQIEYAIAQLIENAVQSTAGNGRIRIELNTMNSESPGDRCGVHMLRNYAVITVRDNGVGMTTDVQSKIFEPFFTGCKRSSKSGLGLAAATGIIKSHGGYIQVRSTTGKGSTLQIYLPMNEVL